MRIAKLQLPAYGHFQSKELHFEGGDECDFHIIYGSNEAGKSTLLRAISELLFGIHKQSPAKFRFGKNISLQARLEQGEQYLDFIRLNKVSDPLQDLEDQPLPESALHPFLYGLNRETFESSYGISHERLRQGGREITEAKGDLGQALLAATGIENIRPLLAQIEQQIKDLLSSAKDKTQSFPALKKQYESLQEQIDEIEQAQSAEKYGQLTQELQLAEQELAEAQKVENELKAVRDQLFKRKTALPILRPFLEQQAALETFADIPSLHAKVLEELESQLQQYQEVAQSVKETELQLAKFCQQREAIEVNPEIIKQKARIEEARDQRESAENREKEISKLQQQLAQLKETTEGLIAHLQLDCDLDSLQDYNLSSQQFEEWQHLLEKKQALHEESEACQQELQEIQLTLQNQGDAADTQIDASFESALEQASNQAQLPAKLKQQTEQETNLERQLKEALERLPYLSVELEELSRLALPLKEELQQFADKWLTSDQQLQDRKQDLDHHLREIEESKNQLDVEIQKAEHADPEQLAQTRQHRDKGWQLVLEDWKGEGASGELEPGVPLEEAYPKAVQQADAAADQLFQNAETAGSIKARRLALHMKEQKTKSLQSAADQALQEHEKLNADWNTLWNPLKIENPGSPAAMLEWWQQVQNILEQRKGLLDLQAEMESEKAVLESLLVKLQKALGQPNTESDLHTLIKTANRILQSKNLIEDTRQKQKKAELRQQSLQETVENFAEEWEGFLETLGLDTSCPLDSVQSVITTYEDLWRNFQDYQKCRNELAVREKSANSYQQHVHELAQTFLSKETVANSSSTQLARQLANELETALENQSSAKVYDQQIQETELTLKDAQNQLQSRKQELEQTCSTYDCENEETLRKLLQRAYEKAEIEKDLAQSKDLLAQQAGEIPLETFIQELQEVKDIEFELLDAETNATAAGNSADAIREKVITIKKDLDQFKSFDNTIEKHRSEQGSIQAQILEQAHTYTKLAWIEDFLSEELRKAEEESGGSLLKRAGELFHELTLGAYTRLDTELDSKLKRHLVGIRTHNDAHELVKADEMSDGTQDQMFLALRLAWLEERLQHAPMPIILDDLLVNFDDSRSQAILKVLAHLSQQTKAQILLFTHHQHVLQLADECLDNGKDFQTQDLSQNEDDPF